MEQVRCPNCRRLLFKVSQLKTGGPVVEIKCPRGFCNRLIQFDGITVKTIEETAEINTARLAGVRR